MFTSYLGNDVTHRLNSFLAEFHITRAEFTALSILWNSAIAPAKLIRAARKASIGYEASEKASPIRHWLITRAESEQAVVALVDRSLLSVVDSFRQARIVKGLSSKRVRHFPDVIPNIGDVELTTKGIRTVMQLYRNVFEWHSAAPCVVFSYPKEGVISAMATTEPYLRESLIRIFGENSSGNLSPIRVTSIANWSDRWWRTRRFGVAAELEIDTTRAIS